MPLSQERHKAGCLPSTMSLVPQTIQFKVNYSQASFFGASTKAIRSLVLRLSEFGKVAKWIMSRVLQGTSSLPDPILPAVLCFAFSSWSCCAVQMGPEMLGLLDQEVLDA